MYLLPLDYVFDRINIDNDKLGGIFEGNFNTRVLMVHWLSYNKMFPEWNNMYQNKGLEVLEMRNKL